MSRGDDYVKVRAILIAPTRDAVGFVKLNNDVNSKPFFIPKSLIHAGDLSKLTYEHATEAVEFRVFEWKAEELDL